MIVLASVEATLELGQAIGRCLEIGDVVALAGPLGVGKTVLAAGILAGLGHDGDVPSPSFPIVIPYDPPAVRIPLSHVDLYRIDNDSALDELGLSDARTDGAVIIEWPERMGSRIWSDMLLLSLSMQNDDARALTVTVPPAWEGRWPPR